MDNIWQPPPTPSILPDGQIIDVTIEGDQPVINPDGSIAIPTDDGGVIIDLSPEKQTTSTDFDTNLAEHMGQMELSRLAEDLLQGIAADDQSKAEWLATREQAIKLLGLRLETPSGDVTTSSAPIEGMATVRHPVLLEATLRAQATACAELLPAAGPAKVEIEGSGLRS